MNSNRGGRTFIPEVNRPSNSSEITLPPRTYELEDLGRTSFAKPIQLYVSAIEISQRGPNYVGAKAN
jgi:hypothetical protein